MTYEPHDLFCSVSPTKESDSRDNLCDDVQAAFEVKNTIFERGGCVTFVFSDLPEEIRAELVDCVEELGWKPENF